MSHKKPDKVPLDLGSTGVTGISASMVAKLREYYKLETKSPVKINEPYQMLGLIDNDLREILGVDFIGLWSNKNIFGFENRGWKIWELFDGTPVLVPALFNTNSEPDGKVYQYPKGNKANLPSAYMPKTGYYFDSIIRQKTIVENELNYQDNLEEFRLLTDEELEDFEIKAENLYKNSDFAIVGIFGGTAFGDIARVPGMSLHNPKGIRDLEEWYISYAARKDYIYNVFHGQCEIALKNLNLIYQAVLNKISVIYISGTDFGTQNGPLISVDTYRHLFKPFHKKINDWIHKHTKWKTFMHSCGSIKPLIDEFIDAGFDILNPLQFSAKDMDPIYLKEKYGSDIVFWGGGIDTQKTLPFGSPPEIRKEVEERINILGKGGGYIFSAIHNIQPKTPIVNLVTLIESIKKFRN